jgi:polyphosphate kinase
MTQKTSAGAMAAFDIENPHLPRSVRKAALGSGDYPYDDELGRKDYASQLLELQKQLVRLQSHIQAEGQLIAIVFEGRDAAGKGGTIKRYLEYLNPRVNRIAALPKPSDRERGEWYFQRYIDYLPSAGETTLFDRSWYNRAGVELVMGFCTASETDQFLVAAPRFEQMIVDDGIHLFKFWLDIGHQMQIQRFHERRHDPLKVWKLSPVDLKALDHWDDYSAARDRMLAATDSLHAPWTVVLSNDKRRARLAVIRTVLDALDYAGKDRDMIGDIDRRIVMTAPHFLDRQKRSD